MAVRVGRHGRVTHELLLDSGGRAIFGHPTPVGMGKCVPANPHQAEFSGYGPKVVLLVGSGMVAASSDVRRKYQSGTRSLVPPFQQGFRQDGVHGKLSIGPFSLSDPAIHSTLL